MGPILAQLLIPLILLLTLPLLLLPLLPLLILLLLPLLSPLLLFLFLLHHATRPMTKVSHSVTWFLSEQMQLNMENGF